MPIFLFDDVTCLSFKACSPLSPQSSEFPSIVKFREESEGNLKGILGYIDDDLVSTDFVSNHR